MYEFFFCPQHGLFRPDNLAMMVAYWDSAWIAAQRVVLWVWSKT